MPIVMPSRRSATASAREVRLSTARNHNETRRSVNADARSAPAQQAEQQQPRAEHDPLARLRQQLELELVVEVVYPRLAAVFAVLHLGVVDQREHAAGIRGVAGGQL